MNNLATGYELPRSWGRQILLGDVLISAATHDVVVQWHYQKAIYIAKIVNEDIWFSLEEFVKAWGTRLEVCKNILFYIE
jgi:hypothetical protein